MYFASEAESRLSRPRRLALIGLAAALFATAVFGWGSFMLSDLGVDPVPSELAVASNTLGG